MKAMMALMYSLLFIICTIVSLLGNPTGAVIIGATGAFAIIMLDCLPSEKKIHAHIREGDADHG